MAGGDLGAPISYLVLEEGTDVLCSEGRRVGKVEHVLAADEEDIFDGLVIDTEAGPGGWRFADAPQVAAIYERGVVLAVPAGEIATLPEPRANPATLEHHGAEDTESPVAHKLRRAWEFISGKY
jgi:hypothetical protein